MNCELLEPFRIQSSRCSIKEGRQTSIKWKERYGVGTEYVLYLIRVGLTKN